MQKLKDGLKTRLASASRHGLPEKKLLRELNFTGRQAREAVLALEEMETAGEVKRPRRGWWRLAEDEVPGWQKQRGRPASGAGGLPGGEEAEGMLSVSAGGSGFVSVGDGRPDVFVPPQYLQDAMTGDRVRVRITEPNNSRGPAGRVVAVVQPRRAEFVGEFSRDDAGRPVIRSLRRDLPPTLPLHVPAAKAHAPLPADGTWVTAKLRRAGGGLTAEFAAVVGSVDSVEHTLDAVMQEFELPPPYTAAQDQAAAALRVRPDLPVEDLTGLTVFTMDPVDAKDYDDALSVQPGRTDATLTVGVHIADVAAIVTPGSELDREAVRRAFTSYLPGRTLPMLPHSLSADLCSLVPGKPRLAHTVFLEIRKEDGRVVGSRRCHGMIRSRARLTYEEGQAFIETGKPSPHWAEGVAETLGELAVLARRMRQRREQHEHYLELGAPEFRIVCSGKPLKVTALERRQPLEACALVEEYMLAANEAVAEETARRRIPGIYRTHAAPDKEDVEQFRMWLRQTFDLSPGRLGGRGAMNQFLAGLSDDAVATLVMQEFLRSLPRAVYEAEVKPHFGLGKNCYSHFTSPIRRYADLVLHQQLIQADIGQAPRPPAEMAEIAGAVSGIEIRTDSAYFAASDRLKLHFLRDRLAENPELSLDGIASRVTADGLIVYISELSLMGLVPARGGDMPRLRCGERVQVRPSRLDPVRGQLELQVAGSHRPAAREFPSRRIHPGRKARAGADAGRPPRRRGGPPSGGRRRKR